jgi:hypothetical protein
MLKMRRTKNGRFAPVFACEVCRNEITEDDGGVCHFLMSSDEQADQFIYMTHKGHCDRVLQGTMKVKMADSDYHTADETECWGWMSIENLIGYLINNIKLDWVNLVDGYAPTKIINALKKNRPKKEYNEFIGKRI